MTDDRASDGARERDHWECPRCGSLLGSGLDYCDGLLLDEEDGGDTRHDRVWSPIAPQLQGDREGLVEAALNIVDFHKTYADSHLGASRLSMADLKIIHRALSERAEAQEPKAQAKAQGYGPDSLDRAALVEAIREAFDMLAPARRLCHERSANGAMIWSSRECDLIHNRVLYVFGVLERALSAPAEATELPRVQATGPAEVSFRWAKAPEPHVEEPRRCSCGDSMERQWVCETCGERRTDDDGPDPSVVAERAERGAPTWEQMAAIGNAGNREPEFRREAPKGQRPLPDRPLMGERPAQGEAELREVGSAMDTLRTLWIDTEYKARWSQAFRDEVEAAFEKLSRALASRPPEGGYV